MPWQSILRHSYDGFNHDPDWNYVFRKCILNEILTPSALVCAPPPRYHSDDKSDIHLEIHQCLDGTFVKKYYDEYLYKAMRRKSVVKRASIVTFDRDILMEQLLLPVCSLYSAWN